MNMNDFLFCSSDSSLTKSLEHCENDFGKDFENYLKLFHCSDDFDFQIIVMIDFDFKITKT